MCKIVIEFNVYIDLDIGSDLSSIIIHQVFAIRNPTQDVCSHENIITYEYERTSLNEKIGRVLLFI